MYVAVPTLIDLKTGQVVLDQMLIVPKNVDSDFLSAEAYKRLKRIPKQDKTETQQQTCVDAVCHFVTAFVRRNRPRARGAFVESYLVQNVLKFYLFLLARSHYTVHRLQKHLLAFSKCIPSVIATKMILHCLGC